MKRSVLQTVNAARRGDVSAQLASGRCYLHGTNAFPHHRAAGIRYLTAAANAGCRDAVHELATSLSLPEVIRHGLMDILRRAAVEGCVQAQYKLGLWLLTEDPSRNEGIEWMRCAARAGLSEARIDLANNLLKSNSSHANNEALRLLKVEALTGRREAMLSLARAALAARDFRLFVDVLYRLCADNRAVVPDISTLVIEALSLERCGRIGELRLPGDVLRTSLEFEAGRETPTAMLLLGRILVGLDERLRARTELSAARKLGRGLALLLRASDHGSAEAWLALADAYELHRKLPSATRMARYCLERAAALGDEAGKIRVGKLLLASARSTADLLRATELLQPLVRSGNAAAASLLSTLRLDVSGDDAQAERVLAAMATRNALLAARLALARAFGLVQHEALTIDIVRARRPWGLWVDPCAFFHQRVKSTPRPVPALNDLALQVIARSATIFENVDAGPDGPEGDYRRRVYTLRAALARAEVGREIFLARAPDDALNWSRVPASRADSQCSNVESLLLS